MAFDIEDFALYSLKSHDRFDLKRTNIAAESDQSITTPYRWKVQFIGNRGDEHRSIRSRVDEKVHINPIAIILLDRCTNNGSYQAILAERPSSDNKH